MQSCLNPESPKSDQHQFSPHNVNNINALIFFQILSTHSLICAVFFNTAYLLTYIENVSDKGHQ